MLYNLQLKTRRGTELLDELASVLSNLYSFNSEVDLDFVSTIILLRRYWDEVRGHVDKGKTECRSEFIRILQKMAILYSRQIYRWLVLLVLSRVTSNPLI